MILTIAILEDDNNDSNLRAIDNGKIMVTVMITM